jgi:macrodomain Ter protein organizer (MatP/YcbG family)
MTEKENENKLKRVTLDLPADLVKVLEEKAQRLDMTLADAIKYFLFYGLEASRGDAHKF